MKSPDIKWRVNIKPESIAMIDYAQIKSERTEFLMSMAQFIQSASGAVAAIPESLPIMLELMKWSMVGFKGAEYLEGTMDVAIDMAKKMPPGGEQEKGPSPEEIKLQIEQIRQQGAQQKQAGEIQKLQMKSQLDMQSQQGKVQGEIAKITASSQANMTAEQMQTQNRLLEIARELESDLAQIQANMQANITVEESQARFDIASQEVDHEFDIESETYKHNLKMNEMNAQNRNREN